MTHKLLPLLPLMLLLAGCATIEPQPKQRKVEVVDSQGTLDPAARAHVLQQLAAESNSEVVEILLDDIVKLSGTPLFLDNQVDLLIDGPETYEYMISDIQTAEHHILLESYIFSDDEVGKAFSRQLQDKSLEGVDVRVIYDSFGSFGSGNAFFKEMEDAGIDVVEFNEISPLKPADLLNVNVRDHRKILVIDGRVAYTGGINFSSTYSSSSEWISSGDQQTSGWRDTHVAVRGPAAAGFQSLFLKTWHAMGGKEDPQLSTPENLEQQGNEVVAILSAEGGDNVQSEIFHAYLRAIESARERIWITQAYFAPDKDFMDLLRQAAHRGVDVRVMVPGVSDSEMLLNASRSRYGDLLKAGVEIFERQNALLHAKTAVIDGVWSTVGSSNLDSRSFLHNDEVNAIILGRHFAKEMEAQFLKDELESLRVTYGEWRERSLWRKLKEKLSWFVEYWI